MFGYSSVLFSEQAKFDVSVLPVGVGPNTINVIVSTIDGDPFSDISGLKIKVSNPQRNISPIEISTIESQSSNGITEFEGEATFGFAGTWQIEIEAQRTQMANESVIFDVLVKPHFQKFELKSQNMIFLKVSRHLSTLDMMVIIQYGLVMQQSLSFGNLL